uniref:Uncharacterized protein n=1 Tax=viral metagenome TaxID=1070528 RepID=A0A6C0D1A2_9ZZZZ
MDPSLEELLNNETIVGEINSMQRHSKAILIEKCQGLSIDMKGLKNKHDFAVRIVATNHGWKGLKKKSVKTTTTSSSSSTQRNNNNEMKKKKNQESIVLETLGEDIITFAKKEEVWKYSIDTEKDAWCPRLQFIFSFKTRRVLGKWNTHQQCILPLTCEDIETCKEKKLPFTISSNLSDIPPHLVQDETYRERISNYIRGGPTTVQEEEEIEEEEDQHQNMEV